MPNVVGSRAFNGISTRLDQEIARCHAQYDGARADLAKSHQESTAREQAIVKQLDALRSGPLADIEQGAGMTKANAKAALKYLRLQAELRRLQEGRRIAFPATTKPGSLRLGGALGDPLAESTDTSCGADSAVLPASAKNVVPKKTHRISRRLSKSANDTSRDADIVDRLREAACRIRHCGDYGNLYWNPTSRTAAWSMGDGDGEPEGSSSQEIRDILGSVEGVEKVEVDAEWVPGDGFYAVPYGLKKGASLVNGQWYGNGDGAHYSLGQRLGQIGEGIRARLSRSSVPGLRAAMQSHGVRYKGSVVHASSQPYGAHRYTHVLTHASSQSAAAALTTHLGRAGYKVGKTTAQRIGATRIHRLTAERAGESHTFEIHERPGQGRVGKSPGPHVAPPSQHREGYTPGVDPNRKPVSSKYNFGSAAAEEGQSHKPAYDPIARKPVVLRPSRPSPMIKSVYAIVLTKGHDTGRFYTADSLRAYVGHVRSARGETDTSPTLGQKEAGNYRKGRVRIHGLSIAIENPKGSSRSGVDPNGKRWSVRMRHDYGYFTRPNGDSRAPMGIDGDPVDAFIGPHPHSQLVFVVDQVNAAGKFDEHKVILGALNEPEARDIYLSNYQSGWRCGPITAMTMDAFKTWLLQHDHSKPVSGDAGLTKSVYAIVLSKAHHDVHDEARVPAGSPEGGQWTAKVRPGDPHPTMPHLSPSTQEERDRAFALGAERRVPPLSWDLKVYEAPEAPNRATFVDLKGRKQYIRSTHAAAAANASKFAKVLDMREKLPALREQVMRDLEPFDPSNRSPDRAIAAIIRLMDLTAMRIGSEEYAEENGTYGASSLLRRHVTLDDTNNSVYLSFAGKHGQHWERIVRDDAVHAAVTAFWDDPETGDGPDARLWPVHEADVRRYMSRFGLTPKQFRTYQATKMATMMLADRVPDEESPKGREKVITEVVKAIAAHLGNTPAVCRGSYIDPEVLDAYRAGTLKRRRFA